MTRLYLPALDGLRFMAFCLVFIHHAPLSGFPILGAIHSIGWIGVELFFAVSGYLFFVLLAAESTASGAINTRRFFLRRFLRLYPALFAVALICLAVTLWFAPNLHALVRFLGLVTFTDNLFTAVEGYAGALRWGAHLWTISFEFQVYLAIPALFLLYSRIGRERFLIALGAILLGAILLRSGAALMSARHPFVWVLPILRPDSIIAGITLAVVAARSPGWVPLAAIAGLLYISIGALPTLGTSGYDVVIYLLVGAASGTTVWLCTTAPFVVRCLSSVIPRHLGRISYGLYLYHLPALGLAGAAVKRLPAMPVPEISTTILALLITVTAAELSYRFIERPFLLRKERLSAVASAPI